MRVSSDESAIRASTSNGVAAAARQPIGSPASAARPLRPMLRVRLLGELAVETGEGLVSPPSRPARELLAWLALHPGRHPRLELASRFWPDVLETSARASLRTA